MVEFSLNLNWMFNEEMTPLRFYSVKVGSWVKYPCTFTYNMIMVGF